MPIRLEKFADIQTIEQVLAREHKNSLDRNELHLDFSRTSWISALAVSTLYCWIAQLLRRGGSVSITPPKPETFGDYLFRHAGVLPRLTELGVSVEMPRGAMAQPPTDRIIAFETFASAADYQSYISRLDESKTRTILLHSSRNPELLSTGEFNRIILQELIDNTFVHGQGADSHYFAFEAGPASAGARKPHPIISPLNGEAYLEICVGDTASINLAMTLQDLVPLGYAPNGEVSSRNKLDKIELAIAHAFDYGSTSKPEVRQQKIIDWLGGAAKNLNSIATGLSNVLSVTKFYGGQIIVRTGGRLGTLDFSDANRGFPRIAFWRNFYRETLATLPGTIVCARVPLARPGTQASRTSLPVHRTLGELISSPEIFTLGLDKLPLDEAAIAQDLRALELRISDALTSSHSRNRIVVVLIDGARLPSKMLGAFLQLLVQIPRFHNSLLVLTDEDQALRLAAEEAALIAGDPTNVFLSRQPSYVIAIDANRTGVFGNFEHREATSLDGEILVSPKGDRSLLREVIYRARENRLRQLLQLPPVLHTDEGTLYLIESYYYVTHFYQVPTIMEFNTSRSTFILWLRDYLMEAAPAVIIYNADFIKHALASLRDLDADILSNTKTIFCHSADDARIVALEAAMGMGSKGPVIIFADVLCTGRFLGKFIQVFPYLDRVSILALVDARVEGTNFYTVPRESNLPVKSVVQHPIRPLYQRPFNTDPRKIMIVDQLTRAPTPLSITPPAAMEEAEFFRRAGEAGCVGAGHFVYRQRHYLHFISFSNLFACFAGNIEAWLRAELSTLTTIPGVLLKNVQGFCLDEDTGIFELAERAARKQGLQRLTILTRDELFAPPATKPAKGRAAWFVLPAISSGRTLRRCLEYARTLGCGAIHISVIVSRSEPEVALSFHQLTGYGDSQATIRSMLSIALPSYSEGQCPACELAHSLEALSSRVGPQRQLLRELLQSAIDELKPLDVKSAGRPRLPETSRQGWPVWREALALSQYVRGEFARFGIRERQELVDSLTDESAEALATAIGRGPDDPRFSSQNLARILYKRNAVHGPCKAWAAKAQYFPGIFQHQLRGFAQLVPDAMAEILPKLLMRRDPEVLASIMVEAARNPTLYWPTVETDAISHDLEYHDVFRELKDFLFSGRGGADIDVVMALHELRVHLTRSNGWGATLFFLRNQLTISDASSADHDYVEKIRALARNFYKKGYKRAAALKRIAENFGEMWEQLEEQEAELGPVWSQCQKFAEAVLSSVIDADWHAETALSAIDQLEAARRTFVDIIDRIALRPGTAMEELRSLASGSATIRSDFIVEIASDCPSLAMTRNDFHEAMFYLLENASSWGGKTSFRFGLLEKEVSYVCLDVVQQNPWLPKQGDRDEGGLARFREILARYGGNVQVTPKSNPLGAVLRANFVAWPIRNQPNRDQRSENA